MGVGIQPMGDTRSIQVNGSLAARLLLIERHQIFWRINIEGEATGRHNFGCDACGKGSIHMGLEAFAVKNVRHAERR